MKRSFSIAAIVGAILLLASACQAAEQMTVGDHINADRAANGVGSVAWSANLSVIAQDWAEHLASVGSLSHSDLSNVPYAWRRLAENVGYGPSLSSVQAGFMRSSGHRANVLDPGWDYVGTGVAHSGSRVYVVHLYMESR